MYFSYNLIHQRLAITKQTIVPFYAVFLLHSPRSYALPPASHPFFGVRVVVIQGGTGETDKPFLELQLACACFV